MLEGGDIEVGDGSKKVLMYYDMTLKGFWG